MKIKIWTITSDTNDGTTTEVFTSTEAAEARYAAKVRVDWERVKEETFPQDAHKAYDALLEVAGYMDYHLLTGHELEVDAVPPERHYARVDELLAACNRQLERARAIAAAARPFVALLDHNEKALLEGQRQLGIAPEQVTDKELLAAYFPDSMVFAHSGELRGPLTVTYKDLRELRAALAVAKFEK